MVVVRANKLENISSHTYRSLDRGIQNIVVAPSTSQHVQISSGVEQFERLKEESEFMNLANERRSRMQHRASMGQSTRLEDPMAPFDMGPELEPPPCLPCSKFESLMFNILMEKGIVELEILGYHDSKPKPPLMNIKISLFSGRIRHRHVYDQNTMEFKTDKSAQSRYQQCEMQKARRILEETLTDSMVELMRNGTYPSLKSRIWYTHLRERETNFINTRSFDLTAHLQRMHHQIRQEELFGRCQNLTMYLARKETSRDRHDALVRGAIQKRVVDRHELSRREQLNMVLERAEQSSKKSIKRNDHLSNIDTRINNEIVKYLLRQTEQFKNEITSWSDRYDEEIEAFDTELLMKKEHKEDIQKQLSQLKEIYYTRDQEIEDYLAIKGARDLMNRKAQMCLILQSWWRGLAFRKKLIPKTKGKKGKKNKKPK